MGGEGGMGGAGGDVPPPVEGALATGRIDSLAIAEQGDMDCQDLNGDNVPDNVFGSPLVTGLANGELATAVAEQQLNLMTIALGLEAPGTDGAFTLALVTADPDGMGGFVADMDGFDADGNPLINFQGAQARGGQLTAGPGNFQLDVPVQGNVLALAVTDTIITSSIGIDGTGLNMNEGVISGRITQEDFMVALDLVPAEFRGIVAALIQPDLDTNGDGVNDSLSVCIRFGASGAPLSGLPFQE
ncbi:MAG: hypothetical protein H6702_03640 [Myxococcales bacterium]|nr:hypothetical protein [Myxococcales bacterium]